jgi:tryptophanase
MIKKFSKWLYSRTHNENESVKKDCVVTPGHWSSPSSYKLAEASNSEPISVTSYELQGDIDIEKLRKLVSAFHNSDVVRRVNDLDFALDHGPPLQQWEIKEVNKVLEKFTAKYKSPLAGALK